jgi:ABC-type multidrug transport system fused ATPase/permease subunit
MSVKDNIRFVKDDEDDETVADAARLGNAHDFIMELPENYETHVAQMSLSGGQKKRICISRAILANCPILLLDEATAALDTESEQLVQQSFETFREGKTVMIVAHRLATVKNANRIIVMQNGRVAETATHDELLSRNGIYAELIKFQLQSIEKLQFIRQLQNGRSVGFLPKLKQ